VCICGKQLTEKSNDFLKFLNKITMIKPIQNSKPAKPSKKKVVDVKVTSSLILPTIATYTYNITHIISEYKIIVNKFFEFNKNIKEENQNKNVQKFTQFNIKKNIII
jgi:hypothetical protein